MVSDLNLTCKITYISDRGKTITIIGTLIELTQDYVDIKIDFKSFRIYSNSYFTLEILGGIK